MPSEAPPQAASRSGPAGSGIADYQASRSGGETGGRTRSERVQFRAPCLEPGRAPGSPRNPRGHGRFLVGRSGRGQPNGLVSRAGWKCVSGLKVRCSNQLSYSPTTILQGAAARATARQNGRKPRWRGRNRAISAHVPRTPGRSRAPRQETPGRRRGRHGLGRAVGPIPTPTRR